MILAIFLIGIRTALSACKVQHCIVAVLRSFKLFLEYSLLHFVHLNKLINRMAKNIFYVIKFS